MPCRFREAVAVAGRAGRLIRQPSAGDDDRISIHIALMSLHASYRTVSDDQPGDLPLQDIYAELIQIRCERIDDVGSLV